jgi:hypothetical protein
MDQEEGGRRRKGEEGGGRREEGWNEDHRVRGIWSNGLKREFRF